MPSNCLWRRLGTAMLCVCLSPVLPQAVGRDYADSGVVVVDSRSSSVPDLLQSPSLCVAPNGNLLAFYSTSAASPNLAYIRASTDSGATWTARATLTGGTAVSEPSLFVHQGNTYMLGHTAGIPVILKSTDNGFNWTRTTLRDSVSYSAGGMPVLIANNRIYLAWQDIIPGAGWPSRFRIIVSSIATTDTLTDRTRWTWSNSQSFPADPAVAVTNGWVEGNMVQAPNGAIWCIARVNEPARGNTAAKFILSSPSTLGFFNRYASTLGDTQAGFFDLPGGVSKFHIIRDTTNSRYLMLSNPYCGGKSRETANPFARNVLALYESTTLSNWKWVTSVIKDDSRELWEDSVAYSGFQQPSFVIKGNDLLCLSRTAYQDSANYHDAKKITFHKVTNYANYLNHDDVIAHYKFDTTNRGFDSSKQGGNKALASGNPVLTTGRVGNAMSFNGTTDYFTMRHRLSSEMHGAPAVTVAFWMRNDTSSGSIFSTCIDGLRVGTEIKLAPGKIILGGRSATADTYQSKSFNFSGTGAWVHVVAVFDSNGNDLKLYLNKIAQSGTGAVSFGSRRYTVSYPDAPDSLGRHSGNSGAEVLYDGLLDEVRVYKRALSQTEINAL
jgi:hypothetical protein